MLILLTDNSRLHGMIRDKATFSEQLNPDGTVSAPAYARYLVKVVGRPDEEALLDQQHITRDRRVYTKHMIRAFIKTSVTKEAWSGAPWVVKPSLAAAYKIPTNIPSNLLETFKNRTAKKADGGGRGASAKPSAQALARSKQEQHGKPTNYDSNPASGDVQMMVRTQDGDVRQKKISGTSVVVVKNEPSPEPIKYPIEDLEIPPEREKPRRPSVKFLEDDLDADNDDEYFVESDIEPEFVGILLEVWDTLNVFCEVFQLDSFTFDDFLQAMRFSSEEVDCELFVEIHCAVLKKLVNSEYDHLGAVQIPLADLQVPTDKQPDGSNEESDEEEEEPVSEPGRRMTRSSLAKAEADNLNTQRNGMVPDSTNAKTHRAEEMLQNYGWIERLRKRDFRNGGWEMVMIGLLNQLSRRPRLQKSCNEILTQLAPLDAEPTQETARVQYSILDLDLRARALQIICMLSLETKAIKNYLEECSNQMTEFRKEKVEFQRERKSG